jgi:hypothetical protein
VFVKLFTGLPGAGKTAQLVAEIVRLAKDEPHRPIYALGINGLKDGLAIPLTMEQLHRWWEELPRGSIIAIDECQEEHLMPKDNGRPAEWVQRIAKVRHFGMTFLLTTQHPANMSAFVRRLVDQHVHTVCKFGTKVISRYTWGRCMDEPEKRRAQKEAIEDIGTLPAEVFNLYTSSQLHTRKARIPRKVYYFVALVVAAVAAVVSVPFLVRRAQQHNVESISGQAAPASGSTAPTPASARRDDGDPDQRLRRENFVEWMRPRVDGLPWSAPMFDHLEVRAQPRLFCMAVDDGRCICHTEQGTRYAVEANRCRQIVADGLYNPFADAIAADHRESRQERPSGEAASPRRSADLPATVDAGGALRRARATATAYTPPTYGEWNPDPFSASTKR